MMMMMDLSLTFVMFSNQYDAGIYQAGTTGGQWNQRNGDGGCSRDHDGASRGQCVIRQFVRLATQLVKLLAF